MARLLPVRERDSVSKIPASCADKEPHENASTHPNPSSYPCAMKLILDTNIVLDWLLFNDARLQPLRDALLQHSTSVLRHAVIEDELQRVLDYPQLQVTPERKAQVLTEYQSHATPASLAFTMTRADLNLPDGFPHCRDADDQVFLALAYHTQADALVSHDKAVLKLRKRAVKFGVRIMDVQQLHALLGATHASG